VFIRRSDAELGGSPEQAGEALIISLPVSYREMLVAALLGGAAESVKNAPFGARIGTEKSTITMVLFSGRATSSLLRAGFVHSVPCM
jgi:hypothetical protein